MPELPEVETIKDELSRRVVGQTITRISVTDAKLVAPVPVGEFCRGLEGQSIESIKRRGKYLLFNLSGKETLVLHFRMTGSLELSTGKAAQPARHTRATIFFANNTCLAFNDPRRFGTMRLIKNEDFLENKLGPEPLSEDFTASFLAQKLRQRSIFIKAALLDQGVLAGMGNMYTDEALFDARIHPEKRANSLTDGEIEALHHSIRKVLSAAIDKKGASVNTYVRPGGERGTAQLGFNVAHRKGQTCPVCGTQIERIKLGGRGTYFCPRCQPEY